MSRAISEDDFEESRKGGLSDDELFEPYSDKRWVQIFFNEACCSFRNSRDGLKRTAGRNPDTVFSVFFSPLPRGRRVTVPNKRRRSPKAPEEPKVKKKPGPKPGWKNKFKPKAYVAYLTQPESYVSFNTQYTYPIQHKLNVTFECVVYLKRIIVCSNVLFQLILVSCYSYMRINKLLLCFHFQRGAAQHLQVSISGLYGCL